MVVTGEGSLRDLSTSVGTELEAINLEYKGARFSSKVTSTGI